MSVEFKILPKAASVIPEPIRPPGRNYYRIGIHADIPGLPKEARLSFARINEFIGNDYARLFDYPFFAEHINNSKRAIVETAERSLSRASEDEPKKVLVLGSGNCLDIPLAELTDRFDKVTLVEVDYESTERAVKALSPLRQSKVTIIAADASGILKEFADGTSQSLGSSIDDFQSSMTAFTQKMTVKGKDLNLGDNYTFVCSQLLMSQLAFLPINFLRVVFKAKYGQDFDNNLEANNSQLFYNLQRLTVEMQQEHIRQLAGLVSPEGTVHLADTYAQLTQGVEEAQIMVHREVVDPIIAKHFSSVFQEPNIWEWVNSPGEKSFIVVANSLDARKEQPVG